VTPRRLIVILAVDLDGEKPWQAQGEFERRKTVADGIYAHNDMLDYATLLDFKEDSERA